jgi:hypothetical protein
MHQFFLSRLLISVPLPATGNYPQQRELRRGRSLLGREEDVHESGLALFKRGATLRRKKAQQTSASAVNTPIPDKHSQGCCGNIAPGPKNGWMIYCYLLTCCIPGFVFRSCGAPLIRACPLICVSCHFRYSKPRTAASLARENGSYQYHYASHGGSWFPYLRFYGECLWDTS